MLKEPALIHQEHPIVIRLIRDIFSEDFDAIYVDKKITKKEIIKYTTKYKNDPEETDFFISDEEIDSILIELDEKYKEKNKEFEKSKKSNI